MLTLKDRPGEAGSSKKGSMEDVPRFRVCILWRNLLSGFMMIGQMSVQILCTMTATTGEEQRFLSVTYLW